MRIEGSDKSVHMRLMTQRSDGTKNRQELLNAAQEVFAQKGVDAPLDLVRQRAGVGRATMYRNFPDRVNLHLALVEDSLQRLEMRDQSDEPGNDTVTSLLSAIVDEVARSPALHLVWDRLREDPEMSAPYIERLRDIVAVPLAQAMQEGSVSPDLTVEDIFLAVRMLGATSRGSCFAERQAEARRALKILLAGLGTNQNSIPETEQ